MKFNDIIRTAMQEQGITQAQLGAQLGIQQNAIANTIARPNISLDKFITIMDVLGYDIVIQSKDTQMTLTKES